jgi:hypothetical protein
MLTSPRRCLLLDRSPEASYPNTPSSAEKLEVDIEKPSEQQVFLCLDSAHFPPARMPIRAQPQSPTGNALVPPFNISVAIQKVFERVIQISVVGKGNIRVDAIRPGLCVTEKYGWRAHAARRIGRNQRGLRLIPLARE